MKTSIKFGALLLASLTALQSCSDISLPEAANKDVQTISGLTHSIDGRSLTLNWTLPAGNVQEVRIYRDNTLIAVTNGPATSYYIERAQTNQNNIYTVKVVTDGGLVSLGQSVEVFIQYTPPTPPPSKGEKLPAAYLLTANSIEELPDDDEIAAAEWFFENIASKGKGMFIKMNELDKISPDKISCLWVMCDLEDGTPAGWNNLPYGLAKDETIAAIKAYHQDGGNLFLTKHATQLLAAIGRTDLAPNIYSSGAGGEGSDHWVMNAQIGVNHDMYYDHRGHDIFKGLENIDPNGYGFETFGLEGPGFREDHNCMWDCNAYGFSGTPNTIVNFEDATNSSVLATWGHVQDYCCAGLVEFYPTAEFDGRCIAIGLSAYEFNQNSGRNIYQDNTELLTKNCLDYLIENGKKGEVAPKAGYLLVEQTDDDELAAIKWFADNYIMAGEGVFVTLNELATLDKAKVSNLWIMCDLEDGTPAGWNNLPYGLGEATTIEALKAYHQEGGNLLLTKHATQLIAAIGRTDLAPNIYGSGAGGEGSDHWVMNAQIGVNHDMYYDHRGHDIFKGLENIDPNGYGFETFGLEGPGFREDHNCMWDCNAYGFSGTPNTIVNFEDAANASVLATWGHVQDYCCAGLVEFYPNSEFDGRCIAIGLSAYEFNQNSGRNIYQDNTELLTKNCINYLK